MLFFKEIKNQKLADTGFKAFYEKECHICSLTLGVVEQMESSHRKNQILEQLKIRPGDYEALKHGDHCRPEQVSRLCRHLGIPTEGLPPCPRLAKKP